MCGSGIEKDGFGEGNWDEPGHALVVGIGIEKLGPLNGAGWVFTNPGHCDVLVCDAFGKPEFGRSSGMSGAPDIVKPLEETVKTRNLDT